MRKLAVLLDRLKEMDLPVLISGETGTGKEMVARIIHRESPRSGGAFLVVDCAAIPAALLDAELFGARAGAFTDLRHDRRGILTLAAGGTVLIDGISEVTLDLQAKLLRVLSEKTVRPLGGEREERLDVRFLFASSRDLAEETREGRFRQDLFYRINVVAVRVPPLRERGEDFRELVQALLAEGPGDPPAVEPEAIERLKDRPWPGNVRELRNVLSRLRLETSRSLDGKALRRVLGEPDTTTTSVFPRRLLDREPLPALHRRLTRDYLLHHFRRLGGDAAALSRFLGVTRRQLYRKLARLGISLAEARRELREGS
jgi:DNA-binding NtrC family response regulator